MFPNAIAMKIKTWFWSVDPEALSIYFDNNRAFRFHASDGYHWGIQELDGLIYIYGVSRPEDVAARAERVPLNPPRTQVGSGEIGRNSYTRQ